MALFFSTGILFGLGVSGPIDPKNGNVQIYDNVFENYEFGVGFYNRFEKSSVNELAFNIDIYHNKFININGPVCKIQGQIQNKTVYSSDSKDLVVYLVNRQDNTADVKINLSNYSGSTTNEKWEFKGTSLTDTNPTWSKNG